MNDDQVTLERLDALDRDVARLDTEAAGLRTRLSDAETGLTAAETARATAAQALEASKTEERVHQRRVEELRGSRGAALRVLETGIGNADAAQRQLEKCDALIDEAETAVLTQLEAQDALNATLDHADRVLATARTTLTLAKAEVPPKLDQNASARITRLAGRSTLLEALPNDLRQRYEGFRSRGRWAVAKIKADVCEACAMTVQPQMAADLRKGRLVACHGCHRWLSDPTLPSA
ncbi:MAG: hypothetical protein ABMB14_10735 [Myxococcota bacterium]